MQISDHQPITAGTQIGNFIVAEKIGSGGIGTVYKARHKLLKQSAAIKIHEYFPEHSTVGISFLQAANYLSQMSHPNIVNLIDYGFFESRAYMTMEYIEGTTLAHIIPTSANPSWVTQVIDIFSQILSAVRYAHYCPYINLTGKLVRGIFHGDVKPENILISRVDGTPQLADFMVPDVQAYLGKPTSELNEVFKPYVDSHYTAEEQQQIHDELIDASTMAFGTPTYMAPEQEEGRVTAQTDIFTLGATLYKVVTNESPLTFQQGHTPRHINPFVPQWMDDLICLAMSPEPSKRYGSVAEMEAIFIENRPSTSRSVFVSIKEWIVGDKIENKIDSISNVSGQLFIGKFNDVIANLNNVGQGDLANALKALKESVMASQTLPEEHKREQVEVINQLGEEAAKPTPNKTLLKMLGNGLMTTLKAIPDLAKAVGTVGPLIEKLYT